MMSRWRVLAGLLATLVPAKASLGETPGTQARPSGTKAGGAQAGFERVWARRTDLAGVGSPALYDVDGDGVDDVLLAGGVMGRFGRAGVISGRSGAVLWKRATADELYTVPCVVRRPGEEPLMVVGGRLPSLFAFGARSGRRVWRAPLGGGINVNAVLPLPDRDGDGVGDLLVVRGGGYDDSHRVPGELVEVSGARGVVLRRHALPDGAETYAVPAGLPGGEWIVATGGLEQPGHLQRLGPRGTPRWSFPSGPSGGFIGSPVVYAGPQRRPWVADIAFWGTVVALDAGDGTVRWRRRLEGLQTEASPAAGAFGGDATPDIVVVASRGRFPVYEEAQVVWLDGRTGEVLGRRPIGKVAVSTPLAFDLDGDGLDETLVLANDRFDQVTGHATMLLFDGRRREVLARWGGLGFAAATPALARLSDGGPWSLVVVTQGQVWRLDLKGRVRPSWPAFRGPTGDGGHGSVRGLGSERPSVRPAGGAGPP